MDDEFRIVYRDDMSEEEFEARMEEQEELMTSDLYDDNNE